MNDTDPGNAPTEKRMPPHTIARYWGVAILFVGLVSAVLIYLFAADDASLDAASEMTGGKMYQHNVELMGGKFALLSDQFTDWLASLWHGRSLAYTVAVLAVAIALLCFWVARLMSMPVTRRPETRRED